MDIEKLCRTCLGLTGPFVSIYDGGSTTGCLADTLAAFTKSKPKRADNLPENVCLVCISEINRCYSFKLKCDNSNRMLRQMFPDTIAEDEPDDEPKQNVVKYNKSVQTLTQAKPESQTVSVQTLEEKNTQKINKMVQTQEFSEVRNENSRKRACKREKPHELGDDDEFITVKKRLTRRTANGDIVELNDEGIILQLQNKDTDENEQEYEQLETVASEADASGNENENETTETTYYELSDTIYNDDVDTVNAQAAENTITKEHYSYGELVPEEDEEYEDLYYDDAEHSEFTVYNNENGEAEIAIKRPATRAATLDAARKQRQTNKRPSKQQQTAQIIDVDDAEDIADIPAEMQATLLKQLHEENGDAEQITGNAKDNTGATPPKMAFNCEHCNAGFAVRKSLNYHRKSKACLAPTYKCDECERVFVSEANLQEHKTTHTHTCTECNQVYQTSDELTQHMIDKHKRKIRNQCQVCKKVFTMLSALKDHWRVHSGEKPYLCTVCGKSFSQNANLRQHLMRHSKEKKYKCDDCANSYVTKAELHSHKRTHTGAQPFKCEFCSKCFTTSSTLVKHRRKHTGERPYACPYCPMRFTALNVLKNHSRTHTGEKPFQCAYCEKRFTQKGDCKIHEQTHNRSHSDVNNTTNSKKRRDDGGNGGSKAKTEDVEIDIMPIEHEEDVDDEEVIDVQPVDDTDAAASSADESLIQLAMKDMC